MPTSLSVFRWSRGERERWQAFDVDAGPDTTVLDALVEIQRRRDPSLAFRYACRVGMCGSCAMVVNGRERWACRTRLVSLRAGAIRVRPLYHFPLLRDLVVDMAPFTARMRAVGAALVPAPDAEPYALIPAGSAGRRGGAPPPRGHAGGLGACGRRGGGPTRRVPRARALTPGLPLAGASR